jgi:YidC/Oxa1 family membrane protein insertase
VRIETGDVVALFTNRGGRLKSWRLKRYTDQKKQPLELVANDLAPMYPLPFSLRVSDDAVTNTLNGALYAVADAPRGGSATTGSTGPLQLTFEYRDSNDLHAVKEFRFDPNSYVVTFRATITSAGRPLSPTIEWGPALGDIDSGSGRYAVKPRGLFSLAGKVQRLDASKIAKQNSYEDDFQYVGVDDHYFLSVALKPGRSKVTFTPVTIPEPAGSASRSLMSYSIARPANEEPLRVYVGPKEFDELAAVDRDFVRAIDFGMFAVIVVPLLRSLNWIHGYVGNYGWSIVLLTVFINLLMFPLRHKSVVSARKMQEIQPEAKAIQERYAKLKTTDPARQKMNQELMALYKERGVNPASGCVPMLLTFPVLLAFYALLQTAIELRGAPFALWIHDLSLPDPYYVTPVLMGASQLWQQWITPAAGIDPTQQKMMMIMPVVFTFLFLSMPSGIALYWFVSTVWGIGQQYVTNYLIGPPAVRTVRPAAERRVKRVSGKPEPTASAKPN